MRAEMGKTPSRAPPSQLHLPAGFRFCPTDEELVVQYLSRKAASQPFSIPIIAEVELYKFDPWDLPDMALFGEKEWYFFSPRDRKYPNGSRPNRAAGSGYWKATGTDKPISALGGSKKVGVKKALVFYSGKAPKGVKTNWIMHEYRLAESASRPGKRKESLRMDDWVLCRIYKKSSSGPKPGKECSDDDSCLEEILDSLPAIDHSKLPSNSPRIQIQKGAGTEQQFVRASTNLQEEAERSDRSEGNWSYEQQMLQAGVPVKIEAVETKTDFVLQNFHCDNRVCEESSQGAGSSQENSHLSHEYSSKQFSPPDSMLEDDSVESTFSSLQSFPSTDRNLTLPFMCGFDSLPSPNFWRLDSGLASPNLGRFETLSAFSDVDFFNFAQ